MRKRFLVFQDSILDTCEDLEGVSFDDASTLVEMERRTPLDPVAAHRGFEDEEAGLAVPPRQMQHGELGDLGHRRTTFSGPGEERDLEARPSFDCGSFYSCRRHCSRHSEHICRCFADLSLADNVF